MSPGNQMNLWAQVLHALADAFGAAPVQPDFQLTWFVLGQSRQFFFFVVFFLMAQYETTKLAVEGRLGVWVTEEKGSFWLNQRWRLSERRTQMVLVSFIFFLLSFNLV